MTCSTGPPLASSRAMPLSWSRAASVRTRVSAKRPFPHLLSSQRYTLAELSRQIPPLYSGARLAPLRFAQLGVAALSTGLVLVGFSASLFERRARRGGSKGEREVATSGDHARGHGGTRSSSLHMIPSQIFAAKHPSSAPAPSRTQRIRTRYGSRPHRTPACRTQLA